MTRFEIGVSGLSLCISFGMLFLAYAGFQKARVDAYRQELFDIRDRLWDYCRGASLLTDPAHVKMRDLLNGMIRIATLSNAVLIIGGIATSPRRSSDSTIDKLISEIQSQEYKAYLVAVRERAIQTMLRFTLSWNVVGILTIVAAIPFLIVDFSRTVGDRQKDWRPSDTGLVRNLFAPHTETEALRLANNH